MRTKQKQALVASAAGAALLVAAGVAYAAIPDSAGVIHGCYAKPSGSLRVIDDSVGSCKPTETPLNWNAQGQQGPAGPAGLPGPAGPTGPPGPAGSTHGYETNTISTIPSNDSHTHSVISISGLPDGDYLVWAQIEALGTPGDMADCALTGTNRTTYTAEEQLSSANTANFALVGAASLAGGSSTVDVECESSGSSMTAYLALSLTPVAALN